MARAAAELFSNRPNPTPGDIAQFRELMTNLLPDLELQDRRLVAALLANHPGAPKSLIQKLAKDDITVAALILTKTPVLAAADLLSIIDTAGSEHAAAIAGRDDLDSGLINALLNLGDANVVSIIGSRSDLKLNSDQLEFISEFARHHSSVAAILARRDDIPFAALASAILSLDSDGRQSLVNIAKQAALALQASGAAIRRRAPDPALARTLVGMAAARDRAALGGLMAEHLGLSPEFARAIIDDGREPFAIALKALWIPDRDATTIMLQLASPASVSLDALRQLCRLYETLTVLAAEQFIAAWQTEKPQADHVPIHDQAVRPDRGDRRIDQPVRDPIRRPRHAPSSLLKRA